MTLVQEPAPLRVGIVGAGPQATFIHGPLFARNDSSDLVGIWSRNNERASTLASSLGCRAFETYEQLLDRADALVFAVPPGVQEELAPIAALAGKALLLEKPLASSVQGAQRIVAAVRDAQVGSLLVLTGRFAPEVRSWLTRARNVKADGGRAWFLTDSFVDGPFAESPWRQQYGALYDLGPHSVDLLEAALGPITSIRISAMRDRGSLILLGHASGAASSATVSGSLRGEQSAGVEVYSAAGVVAVDTLHIDWASTLSTLASEFVAVARGAPHPCDARRGLTIQRLLAGKPSEADDLDESRPVQTLDGSGQTDAPPPIGEFV